MNIIEKNYWILRKSSEVEKSYCGETFNIAIGLTEIFHAK